MTGRKSLGILLVVLAASLALAGSALADSCLKQLVHTDEIQMMGQTQPARDDTAIIWLGENMAAATPKEGRKIIVRGDKGMIYMIDHTSKQYSEMPIEGLGEDTTKGMGAMMSRMSLKVTVTPTEETRKIKDWTATKYLVERNFGMGTAKSETWATQDVEFDSDVYYLASNAIMSMMPGFKEAMEEMKKIKGLTVLNEDETTMMGVTAKSRVELLEFSEKDAPAGMYDVPEGYTKVDMRGPMGR